MPLNSVTDTEIRRLIVETAANCGESAHLGGSLSMVELLNILFGGFLRHRPESPQWEDRDIFILSKGHAVLGYLAVLHAYGYFDRKKLATFQSNGSDLIAHPVKKIELGIESSNGSLGQGLSFGLGVAIGMRKRGQSHRRVFVMMGDGKSESGAVLADVWRAFGWNVIEVDGHDTMAVSKGYADAIAEPSRPSVLVAKTVKGKGIDFMEDNNDWHHNRITPKVLSDCLALLGIEGEHV
jgi:transketolase